MSRTTAMQLHPSPELESELLQVVVHHHPVRYLVQPDFLILPVQTQALCSGLELGTYHEA